jgi:hypothetical protein
MFLGADILVSNSHATELHQIGRSLARSRAITPPKRSETHVVAMSQRSCLCRHTSLGAVVLLATMAAGCKDENQPTQPARPLQARHSAVARPSSRRRAEEPFFTLAGSASSSAGFYFDSTGALVVRVRDSTEYAAARSAAQSLVSAGIGLPSRWHGVISVRPAQFTFYELASWRDSVFAHIIPAFPGVISLDMDEVRNRVVIGLARASSAALRRQLPTALAQVEVDTNAVVLEEQGPVTPLGSGRPLANLRGKSITTSGFADTIVGGIPFGPASGAGGGSVGLVISYNNVRSFLTCSHCTATPMSFEGDTARQPLTGPPYHLIGYEAFDPSAHDCFIGGTNQSCRNSDAAIYTLMDTVKSQIGLIMRTTSSSYGSAGSLTWDTANPYFVVTGTDANPSVGIALQKVGEKTGWTYGSVTATCIDKQETFISAWVFCSTQTDVYNDNGDSGSPTFEWDHGAVVKFAGITWANQDGHYYFSPLTQIQGDLTGTMTIARPATMQAPVLTSSLVGSNPQISWGAVSGATWYYVYRSLDDTHCRGSGFIYQFRTTATSYVDYATSAIGVGLNQCPYAKYYVIATSGTDYSPASSSAYFQLPGGIQ